MVLPLFLKTSRPRYSPPLSSLQEDPDIGRVLKEQGVSLDELLDLRQVLTEKEDQSSYETSRAPLRRKAGKAPISEKSETEPRGQDDEGVTRPHRHPDKDNNETQVMNLPQRSQPRQVRESSAGSRREVQGPGKVQRERPPSRVDMSGVTLEHQLTFLVEEIGFDMLFQETGMRCFANSPSLKSSLKALRHPNSEWARRKIEFLFIQQAKSKKA